MKLRHLALLSLLSAAAVHAASINDSARQLAGLELSADPTLRAAHAKTDATWKQLQTRRLAAITEFASTELAAEHKGCGTVFYPFSGPDALNALSFFPACKNYVLFGLEPVGTLPDLSTEKPARVTEMTQAMAKAQDYLIRRNFFVTQYMGKDLRSPQLNGVVPLMSVMLARMGYELRAIDYRQVDGAEREATDKSTVKAVQLTFGRPGAADQTLFYANFDASNAGLKSNPRFLQYMEKQPAGSTVTMLKAASYLLHAPEFSTMKALVLDKTRVLVQDDTGVPYKALTDAGYDVKLFGSYVKPIEAFSYRYQADLATAYGKLPAHDKLPFEWSYHYKATDVGLQLARKKP